MKIVFLGPASSSHLHNWCRWFCKQGHDVHVVSFDDHEIENTSMHYIGVKTELTSSDVSKLNYLTRAKQVKKCIDEIKPDVISVHFASSYGAVAALSGLKDYVLSVWGSDIYRFPKKSPLHKFLVKYSLSHASKILATSNALAKETEKYTKKDVITTYWGVDSSRFTPEKRTRSFQQDSKLIVGTVKGLEEVYGIDYLIDAVALYKEKHPDIPIELRIAGGGLLEEELKQRVIDKGISDNTTWLGVITQEQAAIEWANLDIGIIPSRRESYGLAAVESQMSGTPIIASDIEGLSETVIEEYSEKVELGNIEAIVEKMEKISRIESFNRVGLAEVARTKFDEDGCFKVIEDVLCQSI